MGKRTHLLIVVAVSLFATAVGSLAAVATGVETALACSVAGPTATARPGENLRPGQTVEISGWGFHEIHFRDPGPRPDPPAVIDAAIAGGLCDFDLSPLTGIDVVWNGGFGQRLGVVDGPEFVVTVRVPNDAATGPATITVGSASVTVYVGPGVPPPPCPLAAVPDGTVNNSCPDPCPLPEAHAGAAPPASGAAVAPGFLPRCPEPCIDHAHTTDQGTAYDYRWDCPDPCAYPEVNPGAAPQAAVPAAPDAMAVWCPPEPCPVYGAPQAAVPAVPDAMAVWCPPDPCPERLADGSANFCPLPDPPAIDGTARVTGLAEAATATSAPTTAVPPGSGAPADGAPGDRPLALVTAMSQRLSRLAHHLMEMFSIGN